MSVRSASRQSKVAPRTTTEIRHIPHAHARGMAPKEGILPSNITEEEADQIELAARARDQHDHNIAHSSSIMGAPSKGSKAWRAQHLSRQASQQTSLSSLTSDEDNFATSPNSSTSSNKKGSSSFELSRVTMPRRISKAESMRLASDLPDPLTMQQTSKPNPLEEDIDFEYHAPEYRLPRDTCQRAFYQIAESKTFDRFILFCIIVNSTTLAFYDPRGLSNIDEQIPLEFLDNFFLGVFTLEMIIKIGAYGFYTTTAQSMRDKLAELELAALAESKGLPPQPPMAPRYLDVNWNRLDFFIVLASFFSFILSRIGRATSQDLDVLRTLRMLRPLRTVNSIPEMRVLIDSLGESAKPMANVMLLCLLLFLIFALIGQQLFSGAMTQRCYKSSAQFEAKPENGSWYAFKTLSGNTFYSSSMILMPDNYTTPIYSRRCGGDYTCPDGFECSISGITPRISNRFESTFGNIDQGGQSRFANPNYGMVSYDDIGHALLNIFVAVTLEGWVDQMYWLQDSYNKYVAVIFFLALIIVGSLFALNLALAVISDNYSANVMSEQRRVASIKDRKEAISGFADIRHQRQVEFEVQEDRKLEEFQERRAAAAAAAAAAEMIASASARDMLDSSDSSLHSEAMSKARAAAEAAAELEAQALESTRPTRRMTMQQRKLMRSSSYYRPKNKFRSSVQDLVMNPRFDWFIMTCIFLNTVILAIPHYNTECLDADGNRNTNDCIRQASPMDTTLNKYLELGNTYFLYIFSAEVCLKVIGLGWLQFLVDRFNVFDLIIVLFGYLEFIPVTRLPGGNGILSAFRIFRLARVFKAAKYWPSMQAIIKTLVDTLPSLFYLTVVLCLLMFIAACSGMQLFGDVGIPLQYRANFSDFGTSMLTVFQILTGENWNEVMYVAVGHTNYAFCAFFIFTFIVGGFVILNLYLAILLSAFDCGEPPEFSLAWVSDIWKNCAKSFEKVKVRKESRGISTDMDKISGTGQRLTHYDFNVDEEEQEKPTLSNEIASKEVERHVLHRERKTALIRKALDDRSCGCISKHNRFRLRLARIVHTQRFDDLILVLIIVSTLILAFESPKLTECGSKCSLFVVLLYADIVFTCIFIIEMIMKIIVYGFINSKAAYLKDPWNVLDFTIVLVGSVSLAMFYLRNSANLGWVRSLRALRALRPLRTIRRAPGMRMAVNTLFDCAPAFLNIGCVAFVFYLAFAIIGVEFFGGKFWYCNDNTVDTVEECVGMYLVKSDDAPNRWEERKWLNPPMNFDNTGTALLTLFEIAGLELWMTPMYSAMDATDIGKQPVRNTNRYACFYFLVFILFGSFLVMNLFVGAVVDNFNRQTKKDHQTEDSPYKNLPAGLAVPPDGLPLQTPDTMKEKDSESQDEKSATAVVAGMVTPGQKAFMNSVGLLFSRKPITRPIPPSHDSPFFGIRRQCYNLVMWGPMKNGRRTLDGSYFELVIMAVVILNTLAMLCYSWKFPGNQTFYEMGESGDRGLPETVTQLQSTPKNDALDIVNNLFTLIFNIELILKLFAWGFAQYFSDRWNKLDAFVVAVSDFVYILETAIKNFNAPINPNLVRILRLVKILRVLRVLSRGKEVIFLIETLLYSFPAIANVAALWLLVIFIYAVIGVSLYGEIPFKDENYHFGMYNEHANFANFGTGIVTLFRMSTGESWNGIMHDVMSVYPSAYIFFSSYILLVAYLLFNLLVAIVLQQFHMESSSHDKDSKAMITIGGDHMACFQDEWVRFDPFASEYIKAIELPLILRRLPPALCPLDECSTSIDVIRTLAHLTINVDSQGRIHFAETYIALIQAAYNRQIETEGQDLSINNLNGIMTQIIAHYPALTTQQLTDKPIVEYFAAQRLQAMWHKAHARKNWDDMLQKLRELKDQDQQLTSTRRRMFSSFRGRSKRSISRVEEGSLPPPPNQQPPPPLEDLSASDFGFESVGEPHGGHRKKELETRLTPDKGGDETKDMIGGEPLGTTL